MSADTNDYNRRRSFIFVAVFGFFAAQNSLNCLPYAQGINRKLARKIRYVKVR